MPKEPLTTKVSERICEHMNKDHTAALIAYAKHYGGLENSQQVKMVSIDSQSLKLLADGETIEIIFEEPVNDSDQAHKKLVEMMKAIPK